MTKQLIDKEFQVKNLAEIFATNILGNECQKGKCFTTCYPLSIHLKNNSIETSIVMGKYKGNIHYWLSLDGTETIVDPTIKQFDKSKTQVFVGKNSDGDYKGEKLDDLNGAIYWWKIPFIDCDLETERLFISVDFNKRISLSIILKAATILYIENEQISLKRDFALSERAEVYFGNINEILVTGKNKELINRLKPALPEEFENLLSKALNKGRCKGSCHQPPNLT